MRDTNTGNIFYHLRKTVKSLENSKKSTSFCYNRNITDSKGREYLIGDVNIN